jgi:hypothetical protein
MADRKISDLTALTTPASGDYLPIVDISEAAAASKNKRITIEELMRGVPNGTAAAPGIAFETDPNTGIYSPGADQLAVATNGTGRLFVDASGNVGLGVLNPTSTANGLDISSGGLSLVVGANNTQTTRTNATTKTSRIASFHYTNTEEPVAIAVADSTATSNVIYFGGSTSLCNAATELIFYTAANNTTATGSERLRITSAGLVGIGTSSPSSKLQVSSGSSGVTPSVNADDLFVETNGTTGITLGASTSGACSIRFADSGSNSAGGIYYDHSGDTFDFATAQTNRVRIDSSGRVGIGTSAPSSLLEIRGASEDGRLTISNSSTTITSGNVLGTIFFRNYDVSLNTNAFAGNVASVAAIAESDYSSPGGARAGIAFSTNDITRPSASGPLALIERMRLDSQGRLGIGDTAPDSTLTIKAATSVVPLRVSGPSSEFARIDTSGRLLVGTSTYSGSGTGFEIEGTGSFGPQIRATAKGSDNYPAYQVFRKSRGASIVQNNDFIFECKAEGFDGSTFVSAASIRVEVDGTPGAGDMPGRLTFFTTADGAAVPTERLRITSAGVLQVADAGNITVGTTTGTKIGTATTQKLGFYNATPVVQPIAVADATDAATAITQLNDLLAKLRTLGIIAT